MAEGEINIDNIIQRLLEVRGSRPGKTVQMTEAEVRGLCLKSRELFLQQPILLELEAPLKICGGFLLSTFHYLHHYTISPVHHLTIFKPATAHCFKGSNMTLLFGQFCMFIRFAPSFHQLSARYHVL